MSLAQTFALTADAFTALDDHNLRSFWKVQSTRPARGISLLTASWTSVTQLTVPGQFSGGEAGSQRITFELLIGKATDDETKYFVPDPAKDAPISQLSRSQPLLTAGNMFDLKWDHLAKQEVTKWGRRSVSLSCLVEGKLLRRPEQSDEDGRATRCKVTITWDKPTREEETASTVTSGERPGCTLL